MMRNHPFSAGRPGEPWCSVCGRSRGSIFHERAFKGDAVPWTEEDFAILVERATPKTPVNVMIRGDRRDEDLVDRTIGLRLTHECKASAGMTAAERRAAFE